MSKEEIKRKLYKLIDGIDDEKILHRLEEDIVEYTTARDKDILDDLTPEQLRELDEAIAEADRGETISEEEFKKNLEEWRTGFKSTNGL